jgi:hypothetical protein
MSLLRLPLVLCIAFGLGGVQPSAASSSRPVDIALVLAVDVSGSINEERFEMQRRGYAAAFVNPEVVEAIAAGPNKAVAVTLVEWSGIGQQRQMIDWTVIDGPAAAEGFGSALNETPRVFSEMTALGDAVDFAAVLLRRSGFEATRMVIDVSGDGRANAGRRAYEARDDAVAAGITINGLPILAEEPGLDVYYRESVIGGIDAFIVVAKDFSSFGEAIRNKLIREIAVTTDRRSLALAASGPGFGP